MCCQWIVAVIVKNGYKYEKKHLLLAVETAIEQH